MRKIFILFLLALGVFNVKAQTIEDYVANHVEHAQWLMRTHELPASIILAVAIHESAAGKSKIARYLNNHFGIKGPNSNTQIKSAYRDYDSIDSSYNHFVSFLQSRSYFRVLFDKYDQYDYKNWARGIQRGGYARSKTWAAQVIAIIKKHELFKYDERPDDYIEPASPIITQKKITPSKGRFYTVKKGDNLSKIAKRFGTSATTLMRKNGLKSSGLKPGQKIKL